MKSASKDIIREIKSNRGRFFSIMALLFISMIAFNGLYMATDLLGSVPEKFYRSTNLEDVNIVSTLGLDERDEVLLDVLPSVRDFEMSNSVDLFLDSESEIIRVETLNERINVPLIIEGRLPEKMNEIAVGYDYFNDKIKFGDILRFLDKEHSEDIEELRLNEFEVVGFVRSPDYLYEEVDEASSIGSGTLNSYAFVLRSAFDVDYFSKARILLKDTETSNSFSDEYVEYVDREIQLLKQSFVDRPKERLATIRGEALEKIDDAQAEIDDANQKLKDAEQELIDARIKLNEGKAEYEDGVITLQEEIAKGNQQIADAKVKLEDALVQIEDGKVQLADARRELNEKKAELEDARVKLADGEKKFNDNYELYADGKKELDDFKEKVRVGREWEKGNDRNKLNYEQDYLNQKAAINSKIAEVDLNIKNYRSQIAYNQEELDANPGYEDLTNRINQLRGYLATEEGNREQLTIELATVQNELDVIERIKREGNENQFVLMGADSYIEEAEAELADAKRQLDDAKIELDDAKAEFADGEAKLKDAENTLDEKDQELKDAEIKHADGVQEVADAEATMREEVAKAEKTLEDARIKIADGEREYAEGLITFEEKSAEARANIDKGQADLDEARDDLNKLKQPTFMINSRNSNNTYFTVHGSPQSLGILTIIFSALALAIALLLALTTMTRMIDERRTLIGTYKGLGYSNGTIAAKFMIFGGVSGVIGAIVGSIIGQQLLGPMVYDIYNTGMVFGIYSGFFKNSLLVVSIAMALATTTLSAYFAVGKTLRENTALLLRPKPPKAGSRIFLENIKPIWNRLGFKNKLTARNIFRYKSRMLMTILGVAGCMGLLMLGFGMKFSISGVLNLQYVDLTNYDLSVVFKEEPSDAEINELGSYMVEDRNITQMVPILQDLLKLEIPKQSTQDVMLLVDMDGDLDTALTLRNRDTNEIYDINNGGVLVSEKLAKLMNLSPGSDLILELEDQDVTATVSGITENYIGHNIYMSGVYYEELTGVVPIQTGVLVELSESDEEAIDTTTEYLLKNKDIISVISNEIQKDHLKKTIDSIDIVIVIIVLISMLLALVVLYNLTNINISERVRELSTMKVLGFYPLELTEYVYKETLILTLIGIGSGLLLGMVLIEFVLAEFAPPNMKFGDPNYPLSFGISAVMTLVFSLIVMVLMHIKLKKIDMVEALKSVD